MPSGCSNLDWLDHCWDWLEKFQTIILFGDSDEPGRKMIRDVVRRLDEGRCMADAEQSYHFLLEKGLKPEDARKILPNSTATHIVMKANIREWRHIFSLRLGKGVYPEMRKLMELL